MNQNQSIRIPLTLASILTALFALLVGSVTAAPHNGDLFKLKQPDGTYVQVRVWGDEFYQRVESLDGYTLIRNPDTRWICYAELSDDASEFVSTDIVYQDPSVAKKITPKSLKNGLPLAKKLKLKKQAIKEKVARSQKLLLGYVIASGPEGAVQGGLVPSVSAAPLSGSVLGLTLLIDFPDVPGNITRDEVDEYANLEGYSGYGNNGSVRDYFYDISNELLDYTNHVTEYYTALHDKSYYTDESISYGTRARELINEALDDLDAGGFDFSILSTDADEYILAINAFYAGQADNAWAKGIWPHQGTLNSRTFDGVHTWSYQITNMGSSLRLNTFCHENGHMICDWPDLYDYGGESSGTGNYCLMSGGNGTNPIPPNPHFRNLKGWETIIEINDDPPGTPKTHTANSFTTYRFSHPSNPIEFFLIESRIQSGRNAHVPDEGLLIWHIDEDGSNQNEQMTPSQHYLVSVEQADGEFHLEMGNNSGGDGDLFHAGYKDAFDDFTLPDARWWSGEESELYISDISAVGASMSFVVSGKALSVAPEDKYSIVGNEGGPFANNCQSYTLTNNSPTTLEWTVSNTTGWLTVSGGNPILAAGASTDVDVCLAASAVNLPPGIYTDTVTFSDITNGFDRLREVELTVLPQNLFAPPLANPSFEIPDLGGGWDDPPIEGWYDVGEMVHESDGQNNGTPYGNQALHMVSSGIWQQIGDFEENIDLEIAALIMPYNDSTARFTVELFAGGDPLLAADDNYVDVVGATLITSDYFEYYGAYNVNYEVSTIFNTGIATVDYDVGDALWLQIRSTGDSAIDNIRVTASSIPDNAAPQPDPASWAVVPHAVWSDAIAMTAVMADDPSGVQYYFSETSDNPGGSDSGWQDSATYIDTGLTSDTQYTYHVRVRDKSPAQNFTDSSPAAAATTDSLPCAYTCGDLDNAGINVDLVDYALFANCWGENPFTNSDCACANLVEYDDQEINLLDLYVLAELFLSDSAFYPPNNCSTSIADPFAPPGPDPMSFAIAPVATGTESITMTATEATDISYVEYNFICTAGGGHDSGWQADRTYVDTGLEPSTEYTYTVAAWDKSVNHNQTAASDPASATTDALDITAPVPNPMTWETAPNGRSKTVISMTATTASDDSGVEYYFECTTLGGHDSGWQDSNFYLDSGLAPNTSYTYTVMARDKSTGQNTTAPSTAIAASTLPAPAGPWVGTDKDVYELNEEITIYFENAAGNSTDWLGFFIDGAIHEDYLSYIYLRGAVNGSESHDGYSDPGNYDIRLFFDDSYDLEASCDIIVYVDDFDAPTPDPMTFATAPYATSDTSIVMVATTATDIYSVEYYFTCTAGGGNDSGWQDSAYYTDTGLTAATEYTYTVTARDKSVNQNTTAASAAMSATTDDEPPTTINLVLPANGGVLESFTSEYGSGWVASDLTNEITDEDGWSSVENPAPYQEFIYSFDSGNSATLDEAVIHGGTAEGQYYSKDVEVWTSADGSSYTLAGGGTLAESDGSIVIVDLGDVVARNIKLVVTSGYDNEYWELAEFEVYGEVID